MCIFIPVISFAQESLDQITLQLKWKHAFQFAGYYAAIDQGYYADAGLEVHLQELNDERSPPEVLLQGDADYAVTGSDLLVQRANGQPVVALATIFQHSPYGFLVLEDSGIKSLEDLRGKRVMLNSGTQDADLQAALRLAGLGASDYVRMQTNFDPLSLERGEVDAFNAYVTDQQWTLQELGINSFFILPQEYGVDFYSDIIATTENEIQNNPDRVRAFLEASLKGWEYALSHEDEIIELILRQYNSQGFSRAKLLFESLVSREMI